MGGKESKKIMCRKKKFLKKNVTKKATKYV
jgi:hypothetical protein